MNSKVPNKVPNKTELAILDLLSESPRMTSVQLADHIGVSPRAIGKAIQSLKEQGLLERIGSNKSGFWKVLPGESTI